MVPDHLILTKDYYQQLLGLTDWHVDIELARYYEVETQASVRYVSSQKKATIKILVVEDYDPTDAAFIDSVEHAVVHELLHILFWFVEYEENTLSNTLYESAINSMARAIVRGTPKAEDHETP